MATVCVLVSSVIIRLVNIEAACKIANTDNKVPSAGKFRSARRIHPESNKAVATVPEEGEEENQSSTAHSHGKQSTQKPRKSPRFSAQMLNEISLTLYFISLLISTIAFIAFVSDLLKEYEPDSSYTPIQEYKTLN